MTNITEEYENTLTSELSESEIEHINRQIPPEAHTPMYNFHKYWSRKTWNVVGKFIETYSPVAGIVFDPFGGSGVTAIEALRRNRKAIICDINPLATELIKLTIKSVDITKLTRAFNDLAIEVKDKINNLYLTQCRKCGAEFPFTCAIWENETCKDIRYYSCPNCNDSQKNGDPLLDFDKKILKDINLHKIQEWYPTNRLYHINGNPFKEKQKFESIDQLFTKRNLYALSMLFEEIEKVSNKDIRRFLMIGFSSMLHLCSRMTPVRPSRPMSSAWTQHSYWYANEFMEQNVWDKFESAIIEKQGLIRAKEESNKYFKKVKFGKSFQEVIDGKADIFIYTGNCLDLMSKIDKNYSGIGCIDYIFTDPPYDSSIQYGELSYLWVSWLKLDHKYLENIDSSEIIHNEKQGKDFEVYASLLRHSFNSMFNILKWNSYLTLTFHNPSFKVRNATIRTGVLSGFELEKIHHQELAHSSPKSLLQPFGSAQGDFYLRFLKPGFNVVGSRPELIDEYRFEKIVVETTIKILAERGEPTPYTILINAIDPELTRQGFFSELDTGLDSEKVLRKHLDVDFILVDAKVGGAAGKLWWLKNPSSVPFLEKIPLTERVEQTVLAILQSKGRITFTDVWEAVSIRFPNSLTSDQTSIRSSLEDYARTVEGGHWIIKSNFKPGYVEKEHTTIIALLCEIGKKKDYQLYVGKVEQSHKLDSPIIKKDGILKDYVNYSKLINLKNATNIETIDDIDLLWIKDDKIIYAFEVESTTSMSSALHRGSNIDHNVPKIMLFPIERYNQFNRKMKSPLFKDSFDKDNWSFIVFQELYKEWIKNKSETDLKNIINKDAGSNAEKKGKENQLSLYLEEQ